MNENTATTIPPVIHPLKALRKASKLSQMAVAMGSKVSPNIIVHTEVYNYRPTLEIQFRIANFLGVDPKAIWMDEQVALGDHQPAPYRHGPVEGREP